ncbi:transcription antitermination factor NusB [Candidatus Roizmanbacteria bacterium CG2_30_33_16]|uniref:Transcription antitermination factor NusB n=5 Tax=Candidatus Roizmaniibacteriota TaxID=1752723 RepID=A0A2M7E5A1_9BACT|nr:transcription antitermination factor NusB [Candidatus Roizmanbacteria bacterium]OIP84856.1 MAG: transcription antitermination factor NusB [Candidatus Roizmanbacteria bacterium CG2_30_33_16]PIP64285.1 MAG: transcription antitermination factor NusB [Candidatus Roizmanbacteria bacterium CG22_combo_CG10-13_8_21_14_all_33_16]PIV62878.1 MAG: transcription antitermination factor NusB [Candidatus Roizmanbacteria bacterium CG01_land_8_20_14_3_00_33_9]PIX70940.1 MAG: transcription antitermination fact
MDPRHQKRIKLLEQLYSHSFNQPQHKSSKSLISDIISNLEAIDVLIKTNAPRFPIKEMAKIDLAIIRLAIFELVFQKTEPEKAIINEAIDLAKEFGSEKSYAFINGVLSKFLLKKNETTKSTGK